MGRTRAQPGPQEEAGGAALLAAAGTALAGQSVFAGEGKCGSLGLSCFYLPGTDVGRLHACESAE